MAVELLEKSRRTCPKKIVWTGLEEALCSNSCSTFHLRRVVLALSWIKKGWPKRSLPAGQLPAASWQTCFMSKNLGQCKLSLPLSHSAVVIAAAVLPVGSECTWQRENTVAGCGRGSMLLTKRKKKVESKTLCKASSQNPLNHLVSHPCLIPGSL